MSPRAHEQRLAVGIWSQPKQHRDSCCDSCVTVHPLIRNKPVFALGRASAPGKCEVTIHSAEGRPTGDVDRLGELYLDHRQHSTGYECDNPAPCQAHCIGRRQGYRRATAADSLRTTRQRLKNPESLPTVEGSG